MEYTNSIPMGGIIPPLMSLPAPELLQKNIGLLEGRALLPVASNLQTTMMSSARSQASFSPEVLKYTLYGGQHIAEQRRAAFERVEKVLGVDDNMKIPPAYTNTDREALYMLGLKFGKAIMDDTLEFKHDVFDVLTHQYALGISSPYGHNPLMFGPTLELQTSPEQRARWMPLVESGKIIGTYVQTELGHGTFVRGLETTATFDQEKDEFVIHSPTVTSTKYWPSALAFTASYAVVMARLVIKEKDHGVHPFLVQIRSLDDYKSMPGVETGDIGSKMGFNTTDMGYAIFNQVRIPRDQMLMGNAKVDREGTYTQPPHAKLAYTTLTYTRVNIINGTSFQLAQAAVIASRFSVVRQQGQGTGSEAIQELPLIQYKSQQYRLLNIFAQAYALRFAGQACEKVYRELLAKQSCGDHTQLASVHALTAALKAYSTQVTADGAEDARKCCGGFGFSDMSGLPNIMGNVISLPTLEGENYVMYQQCARYLMKGVALARINRPMDKSVSYLSNDASRLETTCNFSSEADFLAHNNQLSMFRRRAARLCHLAAELLQNSQEVEKLVFADAWNKHMLALVRAARAHAELHVLERFQDAANSCQDASTKEVLRLLCDLFALNAMENPANPGTLGFFEDAYLNAQQVQIIREAEDKIILKLIPNIIALGDAWDFTDASLGSAIGMYDGNMYERLMAWTKQLPLNVRARENESMHLKGYEGVIGPMLMSRL